MWRFALLAQASCCEVTTPAVGPLDKLPHFGVMEEEPVAPRFCLDKYSFVALFILFH
jgi:hypothetical protein